MHNIPYLTLHPDIEAAIQADLAVNRKHALACADNQALRRNDYENDRSTTLRPAFMRDIEKIMNTPAYARYAGKTQVFSFTENDDISRRGLHVQLVSKIARNIGRLLGLNTDLIEAIALGHDVGHTPFGHAGERYLSACLQRRHGGYFNHNVHSVRVLDQLYLRNISLQTLDGVLCHNGEFEQQVLKLGNTSTFEELDSLVQACNTNEQTIKTLRPSTLEGCVVRISDMIAYIGKDRQDALTMGSISSLNVFDSSVIGVKNAQIINNLTVDIVNNSYGKDCIQMSKEVFEDLRLAKRQNYHIIYNNEGMNGNDDAIMEAMFEELFEHLLNDLRTGNENSTIFRHHIAYLKKQSRELDITHYMKSNPNIIVVDYIASMTDAYFIALHKKLFPHNNYQLFTRTYV